MKLNELLRSLSGKENVELYVDGLKIRSTAQSIFSRFPEYEKREVRGIRLQPQYYLGLEIHIRDNVVGY